MARRPDASLAALLLSQPLVDAGVPPLKASEHWPLLDAVGDPARLLRADAVGLVELGVPAGLADRVERLLAAATALAFALDELEQAGVQVLTALDGGYPSALRERLGAGAPPVLHAVGDLALLAGPLVGLVGLDDPVAAEVAAALAGGGVGVATGAADSADRAATDAAVEAGGHAVGVLAGGLSRVTRDPAVRRAITSGRLCLCTPYAPTAFETPGAVRGRGLVLHALARATVVGGASDGATAGAEAALDRGLGPVLAWTGPGSGAGVEAILDRGTTAVGDPDAVLAAVATKDEDPAVRDLRP